MTEDQVRAIAREAAAEAVKEVLLRMGVGVDDPLEVQRDMQHLRDFRKGVESVKTKGVLTIAGIVFSGFAALLFIGLRDFFKG